MVRVLAVLLIAVPVAALELPETSISYTIEVQLDPATRELDGSETIRWKNPSSGPVERIPMHLYLNAFAHEETSWMRGVPASRFDIEELLGRYDDPWGFSKPVSIKRGGVDLAWSPIAPDDGNLLDRSLIEVALDEPLASGEVLELEVEFDARLPIPMARTGGRDEFFLVSHWFPKIAMFETVGVRGATEDRWNAHQFHGPTEFYAEYADFDVRIGIPEGWGLVATGKGGPESADENGTAWHRYRQRAVHDFAFSTGRWMVDDVSTHDPKGPGGPVEIHIFIPHEAEHQVDRWRYGAEASLDVMGEHVGPYPYETLSVIFSPWWADETLGMEYPTLITAGPGDTIWDTATFSPLRLGEAVTAHEFVHQYFYGMVGSNEFEEAYMDEGFTDYWGGRIMNEIWGDEQGGGSLFGRALSFDSMETLGLPSDRKPAQAVWSGDSWLARDDYKFAHFYNVPAVTMMTAEGLFGRETVDRVFAEYFSRWAFRHPRFEDFLEVAREVGGDGFTDFVVESYTSRRQPDYRVVSMESSMWEPPRGGVDLPEAPPGVDDGAGILTSIHDPGRSREERGGVERRKLTFEPGDPDEGFTLEEDVWYESRVRVEGAGWDHLPIEILFRFADGASIRERWDGHSDFRRYSFLHTARLSEVRIDPDGINFLDPDPANNARLREVDTELTDDWSRWFGGVFQLLFEGVSQWL